MVSSIQKEKYFIYNKFLCEYSEKNVTSYKLTTKEIWDVLMVVYFCFKYNGFFSI